MDQSVSLLHGSKPLANYPNAKKVGNTLYLSGISARQPCGAVRGVHTCEDGSVTKDIQEQTRGVLENMRSILRTVGADLVNLVDITVFLTDMSQYSDFNKVYNEYFKIEEGPARTTVGVASLPGPHLLIEIKGIAIIPS